MGSYILSKPLSAKYNDRAYDIATQDPSVVCSAFLLMKLSVGINLIRFLVQYPQFVSKDL